MNRLQRSMFLLDKLYMRLNRWMQHSTQSHSNYNWLSLWYLRIFLQDTMYKLPHRQHLQKIQLRIVYKRKIQLRSNIPTNMLYNLRSQRMNTSRQHRMNNFLHQQQNRYLLDMLYNHLQTLEKTFQRHTLRMKWSPLRMNMYLLNKRYMNRHRPRNNNRGYNLCMMMLLQQSKYQLHKMYIHSNLPN